MTLVVRALRIVSSCLILVVIAALSPRAAAAAAVCPDSVPGARSSHAMAYDPDHGVTLLFGGVSSATSDQLPRSLWAWDGNRWTCLDADGPPSRTDAELVYDEARHRAVLYGGRTGSGKARRSLTDTWEWDGARWTRGDTTGPGARDHMVVGYDRVSKSVMLYGGVGEIGPFTDTWRWNGQKWEQLSARSAIPGFTNALLSTARGVVLMLAVPDSATDRTDTFSASLAEWVQGTWTLRSSGGPRFSPQAPAAATKSGLLLLASWEKDRRGATYVWDGQRWGDANNAPPSRRGSRVVYDSRRDRVVLFGGDDDRSLLADLWEWDGVRWARRQ